MKLRNSHRRVRSHAKYKNILLLAGGLLALFALINVATWVLYRERTYPRTSVMSATIGSVSYGSLREAINKQHVLPTEILFVRDTVKQTVPLADLGITINIDRSVDSARRQRSWLPVANFFKSPQLKAPIQFNGKISNKTNTILSKVFTQKAVNSQLDLVGDGVNIRAEKNGYQFDASKLQSAITAALDDGSVRVSPPTTKLSPAITKSSLQDDKATLEKQLAVAISFAYGGNSKRAPRTDIAAWHVRSGSVYQLSQDAIVTYITKTGNGFGISVRDSAQAANKVISALKANKDTTITLTKQTVSKTYTYCTAARGVSTSALTAMRTKLSSTYGDARGWSLGGRVAFREVSDGCDFTVWLSAAEQVPSFGGVCDSTWSCRIGDNVVLNYTRWLNASPAWNASGGSLDEYRNMLINHETGHRLGLGHRYCGGSGQPAPVMQQQSINLQGCVFSAWPDASERATLAQSIGIQ